MRGIGDIIEGHHLDYVVYADDVQLFVSFRPDLADAAATQMQACLEDLEEWFKRKRLILNCAKSELILFGTNQQVNKVTAFDIRLCNVPLAVSDAVRDLGFSLDRNLKLEGQVGKVARASYGHLRMLHRVRRFMDTRHRLLLANSLVLSHLNFATSIFAGISNSLIARLQRIIIAAVRVAHGKKGKDAACLRELGFLSAPQIIDLRVASVVYSAVKSPESSIAPLLQDAPKPRVLRSSQEDFLAVPRTRTSTGTRAFSVYAPRLWNTIPRSIRQAETLNSFATQYKTFLLSTS